MTIGWTSRDLDIVEALTRCVRLLTVEQIATIWWPTTRQLRTVRRRLRKLSSGGMLSRTIVNVHPLLKLKQPLVSWSINQSDPDFERTSMRARGRWLRPSQPMEVYGATPIAANLFGSTASRLPPVNHRDHDLLLGQVYVLYRLTRPDEAFHWIGEDARAKAGFRLKDPDAFLIDDSGIKLRAIESAGRYSANQIKSFHNHCAKHEMPYELW